MSDITSKRRVGFWGWFRASFLTGLVVVLPIGLTVYLIWAVVGWIDSWILPLVPTHLTPENLIKGYFGADVHFSVRGVGVIVFLLFTVFVGWVARGFFGRSLIGWGERLVNRMPIVRSLYNGLKQIAETVFTQGDESFEKTCLIEYPRPGVWTVGFVSVRAKGELKAKLNSRGLDEVISVFVPTTPNPTSGFLLYVQEKEVIYLDMSKEDGAKLIVSAGLVYPQEKSAAAGAARNPASD